MVAGSLRVGDCATPRSRRSIDARQPRQSQRTIDAPCASLWRKRTWYHPIAINISSIQASCHACGDSGEAEQQIETIWTKAVVSKRRVWVSSILFAELRPSMFVPGRFASLFEFTRYIRSLATLVTPDPNTMLRAARLRDAKWQRPAGVRQADEKPRSMSLSDAVQIASALWVKEVIGVPDLEFLMFNDWSSNEARAGKGVSLLRLQDHAENAHASPDVTAAVRLTRVQPVMRVHSFQLAGARDRRSPSASVTLRGSIGLETTPTEETAPDSGRRMANDRSNA
jgi:hypothetical protein